MVAPDIVQVSVIAEQLSVAVGFGVMTEAVHTPASEFWVMLTGQLIAGG